MSNRCQFTRQTAAVLMACGLIASLLPGFAAADKADNQWGPGYRITHNGLRIDGIRADNPTNRVIYDNDFFFDAMDFAYLAAQDKIGRVDFRGFIVTRNSHQEDGYVRMVNQYNHYRDLAIQSGLWVPEHIGGAKEPLVMPESGNIDNTQYTLSDGARLIIEQADASTPENPLIVFCGGQFTTVATALLERPDIANNLIVFGAGQVENTYNSDDGWAAYVTAMRAPVVNMREGFAKVDGGYVKSKKQYDPLPKNPLIRDFYNTKVIREQDAGIVDGGTVVWLFNQHLVTGAQRRDMIVPPNLRSDGRLLNSFRDVNRNPYGHLHLPDSSNNYGGMIAAMVDVLKDPRVWDPDYSAKSDLNRPANLRAGTQAIDQTTQAVHIENLKCEYLVNPIGLDCENPRFTWQMKTERPGASQQAYQVIVGTDSADMLNGKGNSWKSERINSGYRLSKEL